MEVKAEQDPNIPEPKVGGVVALMLSVISPAQLWNALLPMLVTLAGIIALVSTLQL